MRIRCERCATTYELDERRLPPHGALVKCTRCEHVFRAAPPGGATSPAAGEQERRPEALASERPNGEERTALFGFATPPGDEHTASIPPPTPSASAAASSRAGEKKAGQGARVAVVDPARRAPPNAPRRAWPWILLAALLAAAILAGGFWLAQRRAATPTTRLPAGVELFPT